MCVFNYEQTKNSVFNSYIIHSEVNCWIDYLSRFFSISPTTSLWMNWISVISFTCGRVELCENLPSLEALDRPPTKQSLHRSINWCYSWPRIEAARRPSYTFTFHFSFILRPRHLLSKTLIKWSSHGLFKHFRFWSKKKRFLNSLIKDLHQEVLFFQATTLY